ncbi:hypothetical protein F9231_07955 [Bacillus safensis]|nr:hypothetical protein F9229_00350 [Bacillus safensis]KAB3546036.1 hypothetical protein F9231_07955 [Bacillus safensis]
MKKIFIAITLLLGSIIYLIFRITKPKLYLNEFSYEVDNPISIKWNYILIDTGFVKDNPNSVYEIWITPIYIIIILSLLLLFFGIKKK